MKTDEAGKRTFEATLEPGELLPLREVERRYIGEVLEVFRGNKTKAVRALGIGRTTLYRKLGLRKD